MVLLELVEERERLGRPVLGERDLRAEDLRAFPARAVLRRLQEPLDGALDDADVLHAVEGGRVLVPRADWPRSSSTAASSSSASSRSAVVAPGTETARLNRGSAASGSERR